MPDEKTPDTNWLDTLAKIRQNDKAEHESDTKANSLGLDLSVLGKQNQAARLLSICDAHNLLRRVQGVLLAGKGTVDIFDRTKEYERAIALVWQGPVSQACIPNPQNPEPYQYILVGATSSKIFVNGQELDFITPEALKRALVWAAENPLHWIPKNKKGKNNK